MAKTCLGCIQYDLKLCNIDGEKKRFPGPGCEFFYPREPRYERYSHEDWLKENKMCEESS